MIEYELQTINNNIFHCVIKHTYDLGMTFCRLQEFYESPYKEIRGKAFDILDFMDLYVKRRNENFFTYPIDWCGFNIPGKVFRKYNTVYFPDYGNRYDITIQNIYSDILKEVRGGDFYIIASEGNSDSTFKHELCHAFYYLDISYKKKVNKLIKENINDTIFKKLENSLKDLGYNKKVTLDEIQAYLSTGYETLTENDSFSIRDEKKVDKISKLFVDNFNAYHDQSSSGSQ